MASAYNPSEIDSGGIRHGVVPSLRLAGTPGWSGEGSSSNIQRDVEMVSLDFDSDRNTPEGLKEKQDTGDTAPTFGTYCVLKRVIGLRFFPCRESFPPAFPLLYRIRIVF